MGSLKKMLGMLPGHGAAARPARELRRARDRPRRGDHPVDDARGAAPAKRASTAPASCASPRAPASRSSDVNQLVERFSEARKMMRQLRRAAACRGCPGMPGPRRRRQEVQGPHGAPAAQGQGEVAAIRPSAPSGAGGGAARRRRAGRARRRLRPRRRTPRTRPSSPTCSCRPASRSSSAAEPRDERRSGLAFCPCPTPLRPSPVLHLRGHVLIGPDEERPEAWVVGGRVTYEAPLAHADEAVDVEGWVVPGLVDAHCHVGLDADGAVDRDDAGGAGARRPRRRGPAAARRRIGGRHPLDRRPRRPAPDHPGRPAHRPAQALHPQLRARDRAGASCRRTSRARPVAATAG